MQFYSFLKEALKKTKNIKPFLFQIKQKKYWVFTLLLLSLFMFIHLSFNNQQRPEEIVDFNAQTNKPLLKGEIDCYRVLSPSLPDISDIDIPKEKLIFFHETSCKSHKAGKIVINARQACAVETAASLNPDYNVYLIYTSPGKIKNEGTESDKILEALQSYTNVKLLHANFDKYLGSSPLKTIVEDGRLEKSHYAMIHSSDLFRYLTLWKYGGIYLDLDVLVIKNFDSLPANFAAAQYPQEVAAGAIGFNKYGVGANYSQICIDYLIKNFDGRKWGIAPDTITALANKICPKNTKYDETHLCDEFTIYSAKEFYAIPYPSWRLFFNEANSDEVSKSVNNSFALHVWNKLSGETKLPLTSTAAYLNFAKKYCPRVIGQLKDHF